MKIVSILILFLLPCCAPNSYQSSKQFHDSIMRDPEKFSANEESLLQHHERTKVEWIDAKGNVVKSYSHSERKLGALSYVPLLSFFLPRNYENYEAIITFKNTRIANVESFYGIITLESESDCNEAIFSCVTKVK